MSDSPIGAVIATLQTRDLERALSLFAVDGSFMSTYGGEAVGLDEVRAELEAFFRGLRGCSYTLESEWHPQESVWICEAVATYQLTDHSERGPFKRVLILRQGEEGITSLRIYGAHEQPLSESPGQYSEVRGPNGWLPTL